MSFGKASTWSGGLHLQTTIGGAISDSIDSITIYSIGNNVGTIETIGGSVDSYRRYYPKLSMLSMLLAITILSIHAIADFIDSIISLRKM